MSTCCNEGNTELEARTEIIIPAMPIVSYMAACGKVERIFTSACHSILYWYLQDHRINQRVYPYSFKRPRNNLTMPHITVELCQLAEIQALFSVIFWTHIFILLWIAPRLTHFSIFLKSSHCASENFCLCDLQTFLYIVIFILFSKLKPSISINSIF